MKPKPTATNPVSTAFGPACAASFFAACGQRQLDAYAQAVLDAARGLCRDSPSFDFSPTLYLDEDSFLALEYWHHRFCGWDWNALRRLDYTGGAILDLGYGPVELVVLPGRSVPASRVIELGGLGERDRALLTYITG